MAQQGGDNEIPITVEDQIAEHRRRLAEITADPRVDQATAIRQIAVEDNAQLVKMRAEQAASAHAEARTVNDPGRESGPTNASKEAPKLKFMTNREQGSSRFINLKREQSEGDRDKSDDDEKAKAENESRELKFASDKNIEDKDHDR